MTNLQLVDEDTEVLAEYGAIFHDPDESPLIWNASPSNLYHFTAYFGINAIPKRIGSTAFNLVKELDTGQPIAISAKPTDRTFTSEIFCVVITGYMLNNKTAEIGDKFNLPYVNGCCTKQVMQPERVGDPTVQLLRIPAYSAEQAHHIHSTVRVVHILGGKGTAIVGMEKKEVRVPLYPGMSMVLEPMCPHHFETEDEPLICLPVHVFSSAGGVENNHPMFNGTFMMNHGAQ